jgi:hypothetical protein
VCEGRLALEVWWDHLRFDGAFVTMGRRSLGIFVVIVIAAAVVKVAGAFVLVGTAVLYRTTPISTC